jgi:hypothetical protein
VNLQHKLNHPLLKVNPAPKHHCYNKEPLNHHHNIILNLDFQVKNHLNKIIIKTDQKVQFNKYLTVANLLLKVKELIQKWKITIKYNPLNYQTIKKIMM